MRHATRILLTTWMLGSATPAARCLAQNGNGSQTSDTQASATQPAATAPTSNQVNELRSQASMLAYLFEQWSAGDAGRLNALRCLNPAEVDPETWKADGLSYAEKLIAILERLEHEGFFDLSKLSDDPAADAQVIGKNPIALVLARREEGAGAAARQIWQFSAATVAKIPEWHQQLDELIARARAEEMEAAQQPAPAVDAVDPLRSPYHMVRQFVLKAQEAQTDSAAYADSMKCLDFSEVEVETAEKNGATYVDQLWAILTYLRDKGRFDREKLPQSPPEDQATLPFSDDVDSTIEVLIVRAAGQWRFAPQTVKKIPVMFAAVGAQLQAKAKDGDKPAAALAPQAIEPSTSDPRGTLLLFLMAMGNNDLRTAVTCIDLSALKDKDASVIFPIAGKIKLILDRDKLIIPSDLPLPAGDRPLTLIKQPAGRIEITLNTGGDREGEWLFSAATVRSIDSLYQAWESKPILPELRDKKLSFWAVPSLYTREYLIPQSLKPRYAGLQYWQWLGIVVALLLGVLVRVVLAVVTPPIARRILSTKQSAVMPSAVRQSLRPMFNLAMVSTWWAGLQILDLGTQTTVWVGGGLRILLAFVAVFAAYRLIDLLSVYFAARAARTVSRLDDVLVPLLQRTAKIVVIAVGVVVVAKVFGFKVGPLLAGLGVGGLAFGLAAQDTLKNFFGSVNVVLDRPFQVGDWVKIGDTEGTVEAVGLRSSRIRTFYNSQVTVPNSEIMNATVDNMGRRRFRRISCMLGVEYSTTPEQLEAFCEGIRELIRTHPYTRKDYFHVYVNAFADSSINILLYCFHETPNWGTELRERQRLFLDIIRLAKRLGVEFAFPTQTLHMHHDSNPPAGPPASPPSPPGEPRSAMQFGKDHAADIVREFLGEDAGKPPPAAF